MRLISPGRKEAMTNRADIKEGLLFFMDGAVYIAMLAAGLMAVIFLFIRLT